MIGLTHYRLLLLGMMSFMFFSGCTLRGSLASWKRETTPQKYELQYTLRDATRELDPWSSFSEGELLTTSWNSTQPVNTLGDRPVELKVEYPHPYRGDGSALVTLTIYSDDLPDDDFEPQTSTWWNLSIWGRRSRKAESHSRPKPHQVLTLELPRDRFELLMNELNREQYLKENTREDSSSSVACLRVEKNGRTVQQAHHPEPMLNQLVRHVYREGEQIYGPRQTHAPSILQTSGLSAPEPEILHSYQP